MVDEREIASQWIGDEPHLVSAAVSPILHQAEPLMLGRSGQVSFERRHLIAQPGDGPPQIEFLPSVHDEHCTERRVAWKSRGRPHVVEHAEHRRFLPRVRGERASSDVGVECGETADEDGRRCRSQQGGAAHGKIGQRHNERQRVPGGDGLLKQKIEHEIGSERDEDGRERRSRGTRQLYHPDQREEENGYGHRGKRPRRDERVVQGKHELSRRGHRPQHPNS